jgi:hypothetical protein
VISDALFDNAHFQIWYRYYSGLFRYPTGRLPQAACGRGGGRRIVRVFKMTSTNGVASGKR